MPDKNFDTSKLEEDFLQSLHQKDFDVFKLEQDFLQIMFQKKLENDTLRSTNKLLENIHASLQGFSESTLSSFDGLLKSEQSNSQSYLDRIGDLTKSNKSFADEALTTIDSLSDEVIEQSVKIDKYQKGTKGHSESTQQKWKLARKYLLEEIPKHKTLLSARKAAAQRAGFTGSTAVKDRRLIQMLPVKK
jgi:hypothetical protein